MAVIVANKSGETDGSMFNVAQRVKSSIPILLISRPSNFVFNEGILQLAGSPYALWDVSELGWDYDHDRGTHYFGLNTSEFKDLFPGEEWGRLSDFIRHNPPTVRFIRELYHSDDVFKNVFPLSYPCLYDIPETQSKEEFDKRVLEVAYTWGLSHEGRKAIHADIWAKSGKYGYMVCDNIGFLNGFIHGESNPKKWLTQNCPHYARYPMETINAVCGSAKISISPAGAGRVCFRHTEVSMNSVMMMWEDNIKWPFEWVDGYNCIKSKEGHEIETLVNALENPNLYDIYCMGVKNCRRYYIDNYISYIEEIINNA